MEGVTIEHSLAPLLDKITKDLRWLPFLRKVGFASEQVAKVKFTVTLPDAAGPASATSAAPATPAPAPAQASMASPGRQ